MKSAGRSSIVDRSVRRRALWRRSAPPSTRGDAAPVGQGFDWVLLERRAPAPICFALVPASRSRTRVLTSALIFAIGSGLSMGKQGRPLGQVLLEPLRFAGGVHGNV